MPARNRRRRRPRSPRRRRRALAPRGSSPGGLRGAPGRCRWVGSVTAVGPLLAAIVDGPESELPVDVWLGAALGGERMTFVDLWWSDPSVVDRTEVGPVPTPSPRRSAATAWSFEPAPRLPEAEHLEAPALLVEAQRRVRRGTGALTRAGPAPSGAMRAGGDRAALSAARSPSPGSLPSRGRGPAAPNRARDVPPRR